MEANDTEQRSPPHPPMVGGLLSHFDKCKSLYSRNISNWWTIEYIVIYEFVRVAVYTVGACCQKSLLGMCDGKITQTMGLAFWVRLVRFPAVPLAMFGYYNSGFLATIMKSEQRKMFIKNKSIPSLIQGLTHSEVGLTTSFDVTVDITSSQPVRPTHLMTRWIIWDIIRALGHIV